MTPASSLSFHLWTPPDCTVTTLMGLKERLSFQFVQLFSYSLQGKMTQTLLACLTWSHMWFLQKETWLSSLEFLLQNFLFTTEKVIWPIDCCFGWCRQLFPENQFPWSSGKASLAVCSILRPRQSSTVAAHGFEWLLLGFHRCCPPDPLKIMFPPNYLP